MGIVSEVKCHRCDRRYSGFRSRCPYCGARRSKRGKRASDSGNSKAKLIIGVLLLIVLIVAVIILISQSGGDDGAVTNPSPSYNDDEGVSSVTSSPIVTIEPTTEVSTEPTDSVQSVEIISYGRVATDISMSVTETAQLKYAVVPADTELTPVWASEDENIVVVLQTGKVTAVGAGMTNITLTIGNVTVKCIVRVH